MSDNNKLVYTAAVEKRFKAPGPQPNGLQAADDGLWCIDQTKPEGVPARLGQRRRTARVPDRHRALPAALHSTVTATCGLLPPGSSSCGEVRSAHRRGAGALPGPRQGPSRPWLKRRRRRGKPSSSHGIEWRDGRIYVAAPPTQRLHVMDADNWTGGALARRPPGLRIHGIGWHSDGRLWVSDTVVGSGAPYGPRERGASGTRSASPSPTRCTA